MFEFILSSSIASCTRLTRTVSTPSPMGLLFSSTNELPESGIITGEPTKSDVFWRKNWLDWASLALIASEKVINS